MNGHAHRMLKSGNEQQSSGICLQIMVDSSSGVILDSRYTPGDNRHSCQDDVVHEGSAAEHVGMVVESHGLYLVGRDQAMDWPMVESFTMVISCLVAIPTLPVTLL